MTRNGNEPSVLAILKALHLDDDAPDLGSSIRLLVGLLALCDQRRHDPTEPFSFTMPLADLAKLARTSIASADRWREKLKSAGYLEYESQHGSRTATAYVFQCDIFETPIPTGFSEVVNESGKAEETRTTTGLPEMRNEAESPVNTGLPHPVNVSQNEKPTRARTPDPSTPDPPLPPRSQPAASDSVTMTNALHQKLTGSGGPRWGFKTDPDLRTELDRLIADGMSYDEIENLCVVATDNARRAPGNWKFYVAVLDTEFRERQRGNGIPGIVRALGRSPSEEAVWDYLKTHDLVSDYHPERMAQLVGAIGSFKDQAYTVGRLNDARESYVRRQSGEDHDSDGRGPAATNQAVARSVG